MSDNEKLKTLKDIEDSFTTTVIFTDDLKAAAREWLKINPEDYTEEIERCPKCKKQRIEWPSIKLIE